MSIEAVHTDMIYQGHEDALISSLQELETCDPYDFVKIKERHAKNLTEMADYLFDNEIWAESLEYYKQAKEVIGSWSVEAIQTDPRYRQLADAIDAASANIDACTNTDYLSGLTRHKANCLTDMGHYFYNKYLYADAMQYYAQARDFLSDDPTILNQLGVCMINLGKYLRAINVFELMERRNSDVDDKALALYNISYCYRLDQEWQKAEVAIKKCLKYNPNDLNSQKILQELRDWISKLSYLSYRRNLFKTNMLHRAERGVPKEVEHDIATPSSTRTP